MDHEYVERNGLVALYRRGLLPPDEEPRFEEHFFACAACQEELDHQRRFELGLKAMQAEDAAVSAVSAAQESPEARPEGKVLRFRLPPRPALWLALAASLLIAPIFVFAWLWQSRTQIERQAASWRDRAEQGEAEKRALSARLAQSERQATENEEKAERLESQLAEIRPPSPGREPLGRPMAPTADTPLLLLTHLRGTEPGTNRLNLRKATGIVQLALDTGDAAGFASYRATLADATGKTLYTEDSLQPNALEVILFTFPRDFFAVGEYRLRLEGQRPAGRFEEIERYRFQVVR